MHGDWRIWSPLLLRFAEVVDNKQVRGDPCVAEFNKHQHFLRICIQACAEFVSEISKTGTDFHLVQRYAKHVHSIHHLYAPHATSITLLCCLILPPYCPQKLPPAPCQRFLRESEDNLSFAYIVCFLYLFGFKFLEYRHAVRHNQSHILDRLWRENLASARTALANKVNYRQMSIALVYWGLLWWSHFKHFITTHARYVGFSRTSDGTCPSRSLTCGSRNQSSPTYRACKSASTSGVSTLCNM